MILTNQIITAFCGCSLVCTKGMGVTASGAKPKQGMTVGAPRWVPFGTKVRIAGREYTVQDRLGVKYEGRWDIYFSKHADALAFGKRTDAVEILDGCKQ